MLAGKKDIGYMGDMPTIVAISKQSVRDVRMVAVLGLANDQCNVFLSRNEAPDFKSPEEAVRWLGGKRVAVPRAAAPTAAARRSCASSASSPSST